MVDVTISRTMLKSKKSPNNMTTFFHAAAFVFGFGLVFTLTWLSGRGTWPKFNTISANYPARRRDSTCDLCAHDIGCFQTDDWMDSYKHERKHELASGSTDQHLQHLQYIAVHRKMSE